MSRPTTVLKYVRFYKKRRKAMCGICWCDVSRHYMLEHARFHDDNDQAEEDRRPGTGAAYGDAVIYTTGHIQFSGWKTESCGPR